MQNFKRKLSLGGGYMTVDIEVTDNRLSICGETEDSFGQNVGELDEFFKYSATPAEKAIIPKLRDIWNKWHLNDMRPGCEHQRAEWDTSEKVEVITYRLTSDALKDQSEIKRQAEEDLIKTGSASISDLNRELLSLPWETKKDPNTSISIHFQKCYKEQKRETKAVGWLYEKEHPKGLLCKPCETCGYKYGSQWLKEDIPADVLGYLKTLGAAA